MRSATEAQIRYLSLHKAASLILTIPSLCVSASLTGVVHDPQGRAVANAAITLVSNTGDARWNSQASPDGNYRFESLAGGDYLLEAHAPGFASYKVDHLRIGSSDRLTEDLQLELGAVQQQISVTSASTPQELEQVSKSLSVVSAASVEQRDTYELAGAVQLTPSVRIINQGGPGSFTEIRLRGLRPQDTSLLVDGLRMRDPSGTQADATAFFEDFLLSDFSQLEVLRGPSSSLYGSNGIGGVINVITDAGGGPTHGDIDVEGGNLGIFRGSASVAGGLANDRLQYSAGLNHLNVTEGINGDQPARTTSAQGRVAYRITPSTQVVARFFGADGFSLLNTEPVGLVPDTTTGIVAATPGVSFTPSGTDGDYRRTNRYETGSVSLLGQPMQAVGYALDYQAVNSTRVYANGPAGPGFQPSGTDRSDYNGGTQTINARVNAQLGGHNLATAGYEWERETFNTASTALPDASSNLNTSARQSSNTVFVQDQIRLFANRLYISVGGRAEYFSLATPLFTPAANAPFASGRFSAPPAAYTGDVSFAYLSPKSGTKLRSHVGRGYRAPSLFERFGAGYDSFFGYTVYGAPTLQPEQSIGVDAGIDQSMLHDKLHVSGTYFYTHIQRAVDFDSSGLINPATDPYGRFLGYLNTRGGLSRGLELSSNWTVTQSLSVSGTYTYTDARERNALVPGVYRSFWIPEHQGTLYAVQRMGKRILVDAVFLASSSYLTELFSSDFTAAAYRFSGQKRLDLGGSYTLPVSDRTNLRFYAQIENALDRTYYEGGFLTPGATVRGGLEVKF